MVSTRNNEYGLKLKARSSTVTNEGFKRIVISPHSKAQMKNMAEPMLARKTTQ